MPYYPVLNSPVGHYHLPITLPNAPPTSPSQLRVTLLLPLPTMVILTVASRTLTLALTLTPRDALTMTNVP
mgnify:CR=1 FL=1